MTAFLHDVATAALPVALILLALAAAARGALWAEVEDAETRRLATRYLEPLSTWCLIAVGTYGIALVGAGDATGLSVAFALALAAGAVALRVTSETATATDEPAAAPAPPPREERASAPPRAPVPAPIPEPVAVRPPGSLWAHPLDDEAARRAGLWRR